MKSGKDVSYTTDRKPSPAKATKERIDRDLRRYHLLTKRIKRVLSMDSPGWLEWVKDKVKVVGDKLKDAKDVVVDKVKEGYEYVKEKVVDTYKNVKEWVVDKTNDVREHFIKPDEAIDNFVHDKLDGDRKLIVELNEKVDDEAKKKRDKAKDKSKKVDEDVEKVINLDLEGLWDLLGGIDVDMPSISFTGFEALGLLPILFKSFRDDLAGWFKFDIAEYQATVKMLEDMTPLPEMR
ncbi:unnamed protein product [marine sediment metagenome]|uniref:Uncharacterized protein n=1 Tax=marine sediment metagenome TaxID=412755 RepID=X1T3Q4_9ZZZZ